MKIFVSANNQQKTELISLNRDQDNELVFSPNLPNDKDYKIFDVFFIFSDSWEELSFPSFESKTVFINMVTETLYENDFPSNVNRINGWP
jgi:hypothetical protein